jgi:hypothetical protein
LVWGDVFFGYSYSAILSTLVYSFMINRIKEVKKTTEEYKKGDIIKDLNMN